MKLSPECCADPLFYDNQIFYSLPLGKPDPKVVCTQDNLYTRQSSEFSWGS